MYRFKSDSRRPSKEDIATSLAYASIFSGEDLGSLHYEVKGSVVEVTAKGKGKSKKKGKIFALEDTKSWPIGDLKHAWLAYVYMKGCRGDYEDYPKIIKKIKSVWKDSPKLLKSLTSINLNHCKQVKKAAAKKAAKTRKSKAKAKAKGKKGKRK